MPNFLKGSIIITIIIKIANTFINAYNNSNLKTFFAAIGRSFKFSGTRKVLSAYANKKPWYRYSFTHKVIVFLANIVDKILAFILSIFKRLIFGSSSAEAIKNSRKMSIKEKCFAIGTLLISIPVGAMIAGILSGSVTTVAIIMCWAVFGLGLIVVVVGAYGKDSLIIRLIKWIISALS